MLDFMLKPRSGLPDSKRPGEGSSRFTVSKQEAGSCVAILGRPGSESDLANRARERFSLELPPGPHRVSSADGVAFVGIGPQSWLAVAPNEAQTSFIALQDAFEGAASVTDQTSAYVWLRLGGAALRSVLAHMVAVDVHERAFRVGDVRCTPAHHISIVMWRLEDLPQGQPRFELLVPRSYAGSFWAALVECAAQFDATGPDGAP